MSLKFNRITALTLLLISDIAAQWLSEHAGRDNLHTSLNSSKDSHSALRAVREQEHCHPLQTCAWFCHLCWVTSYGIGLSEEKKKTQQQHLVSLVSLIAQSNRNTLCIQAYFPHDDQVGSHSTQAWWTQPSCAGCCRPYLHQEERHWHDISIAAGTNQAFALAVLYIWIQKQICSQVGRIGGSVPYTTVICLTISTVQSKCYL